MILNLLILILIVKKFLKFKFKLELNKNKNDDNIIPSDNKNEYLRFYSELSINDFNNNRFFYF